MPLAEIADPVVRLHAQRLVALVTADHIPAIVAKADVIFQQECGAALRWMSAALKQSMIDMWMQKRYFEIVESVVQDRPRNLADRDSRILSNKVESKDDLVAFPLKRVCIRSDDSYEN